MSYFSTLPLPDLVIREGDADARDFTLKQSDGVTPVDLTNRVVELRLRGFRDSQIAKAFRSDTTPGTPAIFITSPTTGGLRFTNPTTPSSAGLQAVAGRYCGYFAIYEAATPTVNPKTVPQPRDFWISMLARIA